MESATFLGLLLYAVDAAENKVGSWELPISVPAAFHLPADTGCGGKAVMHADAQPKNYVSTFAFRAPAAGAGNLTFRALIKHGDTNGGSFYWPIAAASGATKWDEPVDGAPGGDLMLTEKMGAPPVQQWYRADAAGQSCDDVCAANGIGQVCDLAALQAAAAASPTELALTTAPHYTAIAPALSACTASAPSLSDTAERLFFFHRSSASPNTCAVSDLTVPSCAAVPTEGVLKLRRLCPCKTSRRRLTFRPPHALPSSKSDHSAGALTPGPGCPKYTPPTATSDHRRLDASTANDAVAEPMPHANGAASLAAESAMPLASVLALGTLVAALSGGGGVHGAPFALALPPFVLLLAAAQLPRATAHNWIFNPSSRASQASTARPCRAKRTATPDVHVNSGQEFEVEWSTGHGAPPQSGPPHYYTVVKAADEHRLLFVTKSLLEDYFTDAPLDAHLVPAVHWHKRHLSWNSSQVHGPGGGSDDVTHEVEGKVRADPNTDPEYIARAAAFKCAALGRNRKGALVSTSGAASRALPPASSPYKEFAHLVSSPSSLLLPSGLPHRRSGRELH